MKAKHGAPKAAEPVKHSKAEKVDKFDKLVALLKKHGIHFDENAPVEVENAPEDGKE